MQFGTRAVGRRNSVKHRIGSANGDWEEGLQVGGLDPWWRTMKNENWSRKGKNRAILAMALNLMDEQEWEEFEEI